MIWAEFYYYEWRYSLLRKCLLINTAGAQQHSAHVCMLLTTVLTFSPSGVEWCMKYFAGLSHRYSSQKLLAIQDDPFCMVRKSSFIFTKAMWMHLMLSFTTTAGQAIHFPRSPRLRCYEDLASMHEMIRVKLRIMSDRKAFMCLSNEVGFITALIEFFY